MESEPTPAISVSEYLEPLRAAIETATMNILTLSNEGEIVCGCCQQPIRTPEASRAINDRLRETASAAKPEKSSVKFSKQPQGLQDATG